MSPASGPPLEPKMIPAATMEDQEAILEGSLGERTVLSAPPFSSPDPTTENQRMLPVEDGTSAHQAALDAEGVRNAATDYTSLDPKALKALAEERDLGEIEGTGRDGNVLKADLVKALQADDARDMKAADFKAKIEAATTQEELDAVAELYEASEKEYPSVEAAYDKRIEELDAANNQ